MAFQPVFGFISGGVNNDNLLWTCSAALIYLIARVLRRGLTPRLGLALGGVALAGVLTKTSFAGLLPGAALACLIAVWRAPAPQRRPALVGALAAGGVLAIFSGAWLLAAQALFGRTTTTATAGFVSTAVNQRTSLSGQLSYLWQVFLPRLPHMTPFLNFGGEYPLWNPYFQSFIGRFGWFRFGFPMWVNWMALGIFGAIFALVGNALFRARRAVRGRWLELACYLTVMAGYFGLVEVASYRFQVVNHAGFEQVRYLLPLLPFYGLLVAVAAVGAGTAVGARGGRVTGRPGGGALAVCDAPRDRPLLHVALATMPTHVEAPLPTTDARLAPAFDALATGRVRVLSVDVFDTLLFRRVAEPRRRLRAHRRAPARAGSAVAGHDARRVRPRASRGRATGAGAPAGRRRGGRDSARRHLRRASRLPVRPPAARHRAG